MHARSLSKRSSTTNHNLTRCMPVLCSRVGSSSAPLMRRSVCFSGFAAGFRAEPISLASGSIHRLSRWQQTGIGSSEELVYERIYRRISARGECQGARAHLPKIRQVGSGCSLSNAVFRVISSLLDHVERYPRRVKLHNVPYCAAEIIHTEHRLARAQPLISFAGMTSSFRIYRSNADNGLLSS
jgi:hypothetical protein